MNDQQQNLFDIEPPPWEVDDAADEMAAKVVFAEAPWGPFEYSVPDPMRGDILPGKRVKVPLGNRRHLLEAYCIAVAQKAETSKRLKPIAAIIDQQPLIPASMLSVAEWMAEHYLCHLGTVLTAILPLGVRGNVGTKLETFFRVSPQAAEKLGQRKLSPIQAQAFEHLAASPRPLTVRQLAAAVGCSTGPILALRKKGLFDDETRRVQKAEAEETAAPREENITLNADQQKTLAAIAKTLDAGKHETILIHGVTGSGKTEVYIQAIQQTISFGRQAIVLVPEISLTPQTRSRFRARFDRVAVLHSHLSDVERHRHWRRIASGEIQVIVGARSAIFAPAPHLGLIVIDEEHESSFKQDIAPRYHVRDVAQRRAQQENIPLVLGSATPSLESWKRAQDGEYQLVTMPNRVSNLPLPHVATIDLRNEFSSGHSRGAISRQLRRAMTHALDEEGQIILLLNRRGFSTHIQCPSCGDVLKCPDCDVAMTHHREKDIAICHYCDHQIPAPQRCPQCQSTGIRYGGLGTQRLEAEVRARFPHTPCLRMDSDSMKRHGSHEEALARFRSGEIKILLGTQMIAKGLDFPNVTLVGVINADTALHLPDFRASERTFQLVTQVAGRSGRSKKGGHVLVQTFDPDHAAIQAAVRHDFERFAAQELPVRREFGYPPFGHMIRIVVRGASVEATEMVIDAIAKHLQQAADATGVRLRLLGPAPAPLAKLRGKHRYHMLLQSTDPQGLRAVVLQATANIEPPDDVQWVVDVDPLQML